MENPLPERAGGKAVWHAMRATYRRESAAMQLLESEGMGCFIPMRYNEVVHRGHKTRELVPVVRNLLFVHDSRTHGKIIVPDDQMRRFIAVAGTYDDQLLYFAPEELNLAKGTRVRVTGGEFEGQEGVFLRVKGARDRRVVVEIQGVIAVALATVHPSLIEPI